MKTNFVSKKCRDNCFVNFYCKFNGLVVLNHVFKIVKASLMQFWEWSVFGCGIVNISIICKFYRFFWICVAHSGVAEESVNLLGWDTVTGRTVHNVLKVHSAFIIRIRQWTKSGLNWLWWLGAAHTHNEKDEGTMYWTLRNLIFYIAPFRLYTVIWIW